MLILIQVRFRNFIAEYLVVPRDNANLLLNGLSVGLILGLKVKNLLSDSLAVRLVLFCGRQVFNALLYLFVTFFVHFICYFNILNSYAFFYFY
jgi:hypothetical protein